MRGHAVGAIIRREAGGRDPRCNGSAMVDSLGSMLLRRLVPRVALVGLLSVLAGCSSDDGPIGLAAPSITTGVPSVDPGVTRAEPPVTVDPAVPPGPPPGPSSTGAPAVDPGLPSTTAVAIPPTTISVPSAGAAPAPPSATTSAREQVIVGLAVPTQPESAVEAAQDEVMAALGDHGTLSRRLTPTAQMSVAVDPAGRQILDGHPLVARVDVDAPGGFSTTN